jgi:uncharacterized protein YecT (DUF1311 family)
VPFLFDTGSLFAKDISEGNDMQQMNKCIRSYSKTADLKLNDEYKEFKNKISTSCSVCAENRSDSYIKCLSGDAGSTSTILQCIKSEITNQDKDLKIKVDKYIKMDGGIAKTIEPHIKSMDKIIEGNCELFRNIQGDRGEIAYENCRLDELIHYKNNLINFLEMNDAG